MRKEADNIGPRAELEHWKRRMAKFNYLLEQLKRQDVKAALSVLTFAKSKLIMVCTGTVAKLMMRMVTRNFSDLA